MTRYGVKRPVSSLEKARTCRTGLDRAALFGCERPWGTLPFALRTARIQTRHHFPVSASVASLLSALRDAVRSNLVFACVTETAFQCGRPQVTYDRAWRVELLGIEL